MRSRDHRSVRWQRTRSVRPRRRSRSCRTRSSRELNQKKHLAALGLAVAKINHDMRNMLASAQLLSDRLANVDDPLAQRLAPKLVATLDRAIRFCQATLTYGRAVDEPPKLRRFPLRGLVTKSWRWSGSKPPGESRSSTTVADDFEIVADPEQMFRVLMNLIRNGGRGAGKPAREPGQPPSESRVRLAARTTEAVIEVSDTGPGVPPGARAKLFTAFFSSSRAGGSGLGLVIAADLVRGAWRRASCLSPAPARRLRAQGFALLCRGPPSRGANEMRGDRASGAAKPYCQSRGEPVKSLADFLDSDTCVVPPAHVRDGPRGKRPGKRP